MAVYAILPFAALAAALSFQTEPAPDHAESVAITAISPDGAQEIAIRLGRFPGRGEGSLWVAAFVGGRGLGYGDGGAGRLAVAAGRTAVEAETASFQVAGSSQARFLTEGRGSADFSGRVHARALAHESLHPPAGEGAIPVAIDAEFEAWHAPVAVRPGRLEVFGRVTARVTTPERTFELDLPGKWHEQVGERPRFAPRFTYFAAQGKEIALLAVVSGGRAWGFAFDQGAVTPISELTIDELGPPRRAFRVTLEDGQVIEGEAAVLRETSVPIEGQRRPGSTVRVESSLGAMTGHLNDWNPAASAEERD